MLLPQNCCLIKPTVFVSFLQLLKPPLHFPASRGLSLRGKNVRKEREVSPLSLIFASSWETSASREPLHMRYLIFDINGWTLPKNPTTVQRQPLQLVYKIESLLIETILCSLPLKMMSLAPSDSKFYWLITKNDRGTERETLSQDSPPSLANSFCNGNTDREESDHCRSPFSLPFSHPFSKTGQWYQRTGNYLSL